MSKQTSRQASKQGQNSNKQSSNQSSKQTSSANKQTTNISAKQTNSSNKPQTRQAIKQERRQEGRQRRLDAQRRAARNKRILWISLIVAAVIVVATVSAVVFANTHKPTGQNQASQNPTSLPTEQVFNSAYQPVDGIYCDQLEQTAYHHHVHLTIYMNGQKVPFPAGMGIAVNQSGPICYYWLHTHASDGIIHIEAPAQHTFMLQNFLDIWQSFASSNTQFTFPTQLSSPDGWTIYVNGKKVNGDFSKIDISSNQAWHELITLVYNSPNAKPDMPGSYSWQPGL